ncbi:MAG: hypothetical protein WA629_06370 [Candidatus Aquilonibacter sp.]
MSAEPLESRIARMEGVNVQIADRLNGIDSRLDALGGRIDSLDRSLRSEIGSLRSEINGRFAQIDQKFMWVIGIIFTSWTTTIATILLHR